MVVRPLLVANWKMYLRRDEGLRLLTALDEERSAAPLDQLWIAAPTIFLGEMVGAAGHLPIVWGAQDISAEMSGAFTGETSAGMIHDAGGSFSLVGHSERRLYDGETNESAAARTAAALRGGLSAIACIGETALHRRTGRTESVVVAQLEAYLEGTEGLPGEILFAYEPVWAIGTGTAATPRDIEQVMGFLAKRLARSSRPGAPLLYGGSVSSTNIAQLLAVPDVHGFLVGGAGAKREELLAMLRQLPRA